MKIILTKEEIIKLAKKFNNPESHTEVMCYSIDVDIQPETKIFCDKIKKKRE